MQTIRLLALASVWAFSAATAADGPDEDAGRFEAVANRYRAAILRQPRRGTTFDLYYRHYLDAGRVDDLARDFEALAKAEPENSAAALVLGLVQERRGREEEALKAFAKAVELAPKEFYPEYCRGLALAEAHRDDEAVASFGRALAKEPPRAERLEIAKRLGRIHARQGRTAEALKVWGEISARYPDDRLVLQELAELLAEEGQADEAIRAYKKLGELSKGDAYRKLAATVEIGQIQAQQGKLKDAIATFDQAIEQVEPESWLAKDIRRRVEEIYLRGDDAAGLAAYYRERLKARPDDLNAVIRLAAATARLGDREAALKQYRDAVKLAPARKDLREALIAELSRAEKFPEALAEAQALADRSPNDLDALKRLGELHLKAGAAERPAAEAKALAAWKKIAEIRPKDPGLAIQAAEACRRGAGVEARPLGTDKGNDPEKRAKPPADSLLARAALDFYKEGIRRAPAMPQYREFLGEYLHALGRDAEARDAWRAIAEPPRDTAENLRRLAEIYAASGMQDEAIAAVDRALKKEPDRHDLHCLAVDLLARAKKYDAALEQLAAMRKLADDPYLEEQALVRRVTLYGESGNLAEEAAKLAERVKEKEATRDDLWLAALIAESQRRWDDAQGLLDRALKLAPGDVRLLKLKAKIYSDGGDLSGAAEQFRELARREPKMKSAHLRELVRILLDLGRAEEAQAAAEELVKSAPAKAEGYAILANVQFRRGLINAGLETLRRALRVDPRDADTRRLLATSLAQNQKVDEAIEHQWRLFEQAADASEKVAVAGTLTDLLLSQGRGDTIAERLRQMRRQSDDPTTLSLCLVEAMRRSEDYSGARRELSDLLAKKPNDLQILGQLVALAESLGNPEEAVAYQAKIIALNPDPAEREKLATLYLRQGKKDEAGAVYEALAREAKDPDTLLSGIDRAFQNGDDRLVVALARPQWSARPDDWRFGLRLAEALWLTKHEDEATSLFEAIAALPASTKYEKMQAKPALGMATAAVTAPGRGMPRNVAPAMPNEVYQARAGLTNPQNPRRNNGFGPGGRANSLDGAQGVALVYLHEAARRKGREGAWLDDQLARAKADLGVLRRLYYVSQAYTMYGAPPTAGTQTDSVAKHTQLKVALLDRWIELSPSDSDARLIRFQQAAAPQPGGPGSPRQSLAEVRAHYAWFKEHRPDMVYQVAPTFIQILRAQGERDEARELIVSLIKTADASTFGQVAYFANDGNSQDPKILELVTARAAELEKTANGAQVRGVMSGLQQQAMQAALARADWDQAIATFDRLMAVSQPASLRTGSAGGGMLLQGGGSMPMHIYYNRLGSRRMGFATYPGGFDNDSYPTPSALLDASRFQLLTSLYQPLKAVGQADRLGELIDGRLKDTQGVPRQSWRLAKSAFDWWEGDRAAAVAGLEKVVAAYPNDVDMALLRSRALAANGDLPGALAAIAPLRIPFGTQAKALEQARLSLAQRAGDQEAAKSAALRLFALRLDANEQIQLAPTLRRMGLTTQSQQLDQRAELNARNNPNLLVSLMQQHAQDDPAKAATLARTLLQQVKRAKATTLNNGNYARSAALRVLKQVGELDRMIAHTEAQLAASPGSAALLEDLVELYTASEQEDKLLAAARQLLAARSDDLPLRIQATGIMARRGHHAEVVESLGPVWEKEPAQLLQQIQTYLPSYAAAGKIDDLAARLRKFKDDPQFQQSTWPLVNLLQNFAHSDLGMKPEDVIAFYRAAIEVLPENQRGATALQFAEYLAKHARKPEAYAIYKASFFPAAPEPKPVGGPVAVPGATVVTSTRVFTSMARADTPAGQFSSSQRLVQLAGELKKLDELSEEARKFGEARADWRLRCDLLRAMIRRRQGDEKPLVSLAESLTGEDRAKARGELGEALPTLTGELSDSKEPATLKAAIALWQEGTRAAPGSPPVLDAATRTRIANAWIKLGDRKNAREALIAKLESTERTGIAPQNSAQYRLQELLNIATSLRSLGFPLYALARYDTILRDPALAVMAQQGNPYLATQAQEGLGQCVAALLRGDRSETFQALTAAIDGDKPSESVAPFLVAVDPISPEERQNVSYADPNQDPRLRKDIPQLLPGLIEHAKKAGALDALAAKIAAARARPDADGTRLQAIAALVAFTREKPADAATILDAWDAIPPDVKKKSAWAAEPEVWLVAREALAHEATRPLGKALASAVHAAAERQGRLGRAMAAFEAVAEATLDEPDGEDAVKALLATRKGSGPAHLLIARVLIRRKKTDAGIALLNQVWRVDPAAVLRNGKDVVDLYLDAGRPDALAEGIRSVTDPNQRQQLGWQLGNAIHNALNQASRADDILGLLRASMAIDETNRTNQSWAYVQAFGRLDQDAETLAAYRRAAFPAAKDEGMIWPFARPMADLAKALELLDDLDAACDRAMRDHPSWRPQGEFLKALILARRGDDAALLAFARRRAADPTFARAVAPGLTTLRDELSASKAPEAIRQAISLWMTPAGPGQVHSANDTNTLIQVAGLYLRLDEKDKARGLLIDALKLPIGNFQNRTQQAQQEAYRRQNVAREMAKLGFLLDAIATYDSIAGLENASTDNQNGMAHQYQMAHTAGRDAVREILNKATDAALTALEAALKGDPNSPGLAPFVAVFEYVPGNNGQNREKEARPFEQLLPALLARARASGRLDAIAESAAAARARRPDDVPLLTVSALIASAREDHDGAASLFRDLAGRVEARSALGAESAAWLGAVEANRRPETHETGVTLSAAVARATEGLGFRIRNEAALSVLAAEVAARGGPEAARKLTVGREDDPIAQYALALALGREGKAGPAAVAFDHAWKADTRGLVSRFDAVIPACLDSGLGPALAGAFRELNDADLKQSFRYNVVNAIENASRDRDSRAAEVIALFRAAVSLQDRTDSYAEEHLASYLARLDRKEEALEVRRAMVLPPTGPADRLGPNPGALVDLAKGLGRLDALEAEARAALEKTPAWGARGELFLAILARGAGKEDPLVALASRYRSDPALAKAMEPARGEFLNELSQAKSRLALELARDLARENIERRRSEPNPNHFDTSAEEQLARILNSLGEKDEARRTWLATLDRPLPSHQDANYREYSRLMNRARVASGLSQAGFRLDALGLYARVVSTPWPMKDPSWDPKVWQRNHRNEHRRVLLDVLSEDLDPAVNRLLEGLESKGEPDLSFLLTVSSEPWSPREQARIADRARGPDPAWAQLAPAVLEAAKRSGRLDDLIARIASARERFPKNEPLAALEGLAKMAGGDAAGASSAIEETAARLKKDSARALRPEILLLARAAVADPALRASGSALRAAAFEGAGKRPAVEVQAWLLDAIPGDEGRRELLASHAPDAARVLEWHRAEAAEREQLGRWASAAWHLDHAVAAEPERPELLARRARAFACLGLADRAIDDFRKVSDRPALLIASADGAIDAPGIDFGKLDRFSVEGWVFGWSGPILSQGRGGDDYSCLNLGAGPQYDSNWWTAGGERLFTAVMPGSGGWTHVAMVYDGKRQMLFVDGKRVFSREARRPVSLESPGRLVIGPRPGSEAFDGGGFLGAVRVSSVARYDEDFAPERSLKGDPDSLLLLDLSDVPDGESIPDLSPRKGDAKRRGTVFVKPRGRN